MVCNSFEEFSYVLPNPPHLFPSQIQFSAYEHVLSQSDLPKAALNSVVITLLTALFTVLVASLSAYGFARIDFFGREALFRVYLFTLMLPGFLGIIPQFLVLQGHRPGPKRPDRHQGGADFALCGAGICGNTFFLGATWPRCPRSWKKPSRSTGRAHDHLPVMLPLALPAIGTLAIFCLQGTWEEFFSAKVILAACETRSRCP